MSPAIIEILVLAGIAIFLVLRLKNVLGTREGFEKPPIQDAPPANNNRDFRVIEGGEDTDITDNVDKKSSSAEAMAIMKKVDTEFMVNDFLSGARSAYEMILMAFDSVDISSVQRFLSSEIKENFEEAIQERDQKGLSIDAEFLGLRDTAIKNVSFNIKDRVAEISVSFLADIKSIVKNNQGEVIEGKEAETKKQFDVWVFSREIGSDNPNWILVETGA